MGRISARLPDSFSESLGRLAHQYGITKTDLLVTAVSNLLENHEEDLPEYLQRDVTHDRIVRENKHRMRRLQFKQRVHDKLSSFLEDERGNRKRFPPHPQYVESDYIDSLRTAIDEEYAERADEFHAFLDAELQAYRMKHPATSGDAKRDRQSVVYQIAYHIDNERTDLAIQYAERVASSDAWRSHDGAKELVKEARQKLEQSGPEWLQEWEESAGGSVGAES